jgi:hypothetical protein
MDSDLSTRLLAILQAHPEGLGEHALMRLLHAEGQAGFQPEALREPLALFRAHFRLFHVLYRLRDELLAARAGILAIGPLCIALKPYHPGSGPAVAESDPLRDYYLDPSHLESTTADDVARLLAAFWSRFEARSQREQALAVLGLGDPVDGPTIKRRYRALAMCHHPDRGGDPERFRAVRRAFEVLVRCGSA